MGTVEYLDGKLLKFAKPEVPMPADDAARAELVRHADAVLVAPRLDLGAAVADTLHQHFRRVLQFQDRYALYLRKHRVHRDR
jgi:hypothetical protein